MPQTHDHVAGCHMCELYSRLGPDSLLWNDEHWVASGIVDVPDWVMVATRRHAEGSWGLNDEEARGLGPVLRALSGALRQAVGAERVHIAAQGENALHFHYMLMARRPGQKPVFDSAEIGRRTPELADAAKAAAVADRIRTLLAER